MPMIKTTPDLAQAVRDFVLQGFRPRYGQMKDKFATDPRWQRLRELGTELWLDTGDIDDAGELWTREFTALTTNNTLLNKEVQKGIYDDVITEAARLLHDYNLDDQQMILEIAFILNARHALKLVERFDAYVSVEEHTDLADDMPQAIAYGRRYHDICPQRFYVKLPFTPAGLLATRVLATDGVAVNHTLGFSARQNYVVARLARPEYVNVFLGRLNSVVADNKLGSGRLVGERATLASQLAVRHLRDTRQVPTRQIGASFREPMQVSLLSGMDVMTMPPKVAKGFLDMNIPPVEVHDRSGAHYEPDFDKWIDPDELGIDSLWEIGQDLIQCVDDIEQENLQTFSPQDLAEFFAQHGQGDFLPRWTEQQIQASFDEGKIPDLSHWRDVLRGRHCAMDSLMNLAGLQSFRKDQKAMDDRVRQVMARKT